MSTSDWIQVTVGVVLSLTLLAVLWYAWETRGMAQASRRMAQEIEKQRVDLFRPLVLLRAGKLVISEDEFETIVLDENQDPPILSANVANIGVGPALDVRVEIQSKLLSFAPLAAGQSYPANIRVTRDMSSPPRELTVKLHYKDVFSNGKVTSQKFVFVGPDYAIEQTKVTDL